MTTETVRTARDSALHPLDDPVRSSLRGAHARFAVWSGRIARYEAEVAGFVGHPRADNLSAIRLYESLGFALRQRSVLTRVRTPGGGER